MSFRRLMTIALVIYAVGLPFYADREYAEIDDKLRDRAPGYFVTLRDGVTHFDLTGPKDGELVVLVHGFSTPLYVWGRLPIMLADAGYRVLRYDLYGRGLSGRPDVVYDRQLYHNQLLDLLNALRVERPVHLVGLSMGGAIATEFTATTRGRVHTLSVIDPAGFPMPMPAASMLMRVPLLGDYLMKLMGDRVLVAANEKAVYDKSLVPDLQRRFAYQLRYVGTKRAILSTLRHMPLTEMSRYFNRVGDLGTPTMVVWGRYDEIIPLENAARVRLALQSRDFLGVDNAGHLPHYEKPEIVGPGMVAFLGKNPVPEPTPRRAPSRKKTEK